MTRPVNVAVLGATGSIGQQTLDVIDRNPARLRLFGLTEGRRSTDRKADYLRHVVDEIRTANPKMGEDETLAGEAQRLAHADELGRLSRELDQSLDTAGLARAASCSQRSSVSTRRSRAGAAARRRFRQRRRAGAHRPGVRGQHRCRPEPPGGHRAAARRAVSSHAEVRAGPAGCARDARCRGARSGCRYRRPGLARAGRAARASRGRFHPRLYSLDG
jgi:hypothetical protein